MRGLNVWTGCLPPRIGIVLSNGVDAPGEQAEFLKDISQKGISVCRILGQV